MNLVNDNRPLLRLDQRITVSGSTVDDVERRFSKRDVSRDVAIKGSSKFLRNLIDGLLAEIAVFEYFNSKGVDVREPDLRVLEGEKPFYPDLGTVTVKSTHKPLDRTTSWVMQIGKGADKSMIAGETPVVCCCDKRKEKSGVSWLIVWVVHGVTFSAIKRDMRIKSFNDQKRAIYHEDLEFIHRF